MSCLFVFQEMYECSPHYENLGILKLSNREIKNEMLVKCLINRKGHFCALQNCLFVSSSFPASFLFLSTPYFSKHSKFYEKVNIPLRISWADVSTNVLEVKYRISGTPEVEICSILFRCTISC